MRKLLVVVDMQNDFTVGCLGNKECEAVVPEVVTLMKSGEYDGVVITMDSHDSSYLNTQEGRKLPVAHCIVNTEGWRLHEDVREALEYCDYVETVYKPTFGYFIFDKVDAKGYDEIHFCGVCTGICVISNVLIAKATLPEVKICVVENACACVTPESHKTAIEAMKTCQVDII